MGFRYALEQNTVRDKATDTLTPLAFSFDSYSVYLRSDEAKKNRYGITFFTRSDKYAYGKRFYPGRQELEPEPADRITGKSKTPVLPEYHIPQIKSV